MLFGGCGVDAEGQPAIFNETWLLTTQEPMAWENADVMGDVPSPRWRHTATLLPSDGGILVFGGHWKGKRYNDVHVFNVEKKEWEIKECSGTPPPPRSHHTASLVTFPAEAPHEGVEGEGKPKEDKLIIIGGYGGSGTARDFFADIHVLELSTWTWTKVRAKRDAAAGALWGGGGVRSCGLEAPAMPPRAPPCAIRRRPPRAAAPQGLLFEYVCARPSLAGEQRARQPAQGTLGPHGLHLGHDDHRAGRPRLVCWQGLYGPL